MYILFGRIKNVFEILNSSRTSRSAPLAISLLSSTSASSSSLSYDEMLDVCVDVRKHLRVRARATTKKIPNATVSEPEVSHKVRWGECANVKRVYFRGTAKGLLCLSLYTNAQLFWPSALDVHARICHILHIYNIVYRVVVDNVEPCAVHILFRGHLRETHTQTRAQHLNLEVRCGPMLCGIVEYVCLYVSVWVLL